MTKRRAPSRVLMALALAASVGLTACGDDEEEEGATGSRGSAVTEVAFELEGSGKKTTMTAPRSVNGGTVRITFKNSTKKAGGAQLIRVEGDHTVKEALAAAQPWGEKGKPLPEWVRLAGGPGDTEPGETSTVTQPMSAGKYAAVDIESNTFAEFEVTGGEEGELSSPAARIEAVEYGFNVSALKAGKSEVLFDNTGGEPHFVVGLPIKPGKTIEDVKKFIETEKGEPPIDEENGTFDTAVLDGGAKQVIEVELEKGKYALLCFIPDRKGGPPHVAKGMVSEAVVE